MNRLLFTISAVLTVGSAGVWLVNIKKALASSHLWHIYGLPTLLAAMIALLVYEGRTWNTQGVRETKYLLCFASAALMLSAIELL